MSGTPISVVVTGAGGFVGGEIARALAGQGHAVTAMVRRPVPEDAFGGGVTVRQDDLMAAGSMPDSFDCIIHCAAEIPGRCPNPRMLFRSNVGTVGQVCTAALGARARSIVFTSSMAVYGMISVPEVTEDLPSFDADMYGRSKIEGEGLVAAAVDRGLPSALVLRLPGTVGRGSHDNFLSDALLKVQAGEPIAARNPEALFNNIVYIGDLVSFVGAFIRAPRPGYTVTNLAAREPIPIREVFAALFTAAGRPHRVCYETGGRPPFLISTARAHALGYRPMTVSQSVTAFVRDNLSPPDPHD